MKCYIKGYDRSKYDMDAKKVFQYDVEIMSFEVVKGEENTGMSFSKDLQDDLHEYLILHFKDGSQTVYRNTRVELFRY